MKYHQGREYRQSGFEKNRLNDEGHSATLEKLREKRRREQE